MFLLQNCELLIQLPKKKSSLILKIVLRNLDYDIPRDQASEEKEKKYQVSLISKNSLVSIFSSSEFLKTVDIRFKTIIHGTVCFIKKQYIFS
jgi:hypothetical protein